jgi:protein tyrosine phosphatase (PTP) superfamily phosphohydrolase (DUF442 family)
MSATTTAIGAVLALSVLAGSYAAGRHDGRELAAAAAEREQLVAARAADVAASAAAAAISKIEVKHVQIRQALEREVVERPVFRDCRSGPDAVRLFNSAIPAEPGASAAAGGGELPTAAAPGG